MFEKTMARGSFVAALAATMLGGTARADFIPPNLPPGSQYLVMFVTADSTQATSSDIATYDNFVQTEASLSPTLPAATWSAVATTQSFPAIQASTTTNIPVYDTQGHQLEPDFPSLFSDPNFAGPWYNQYGNPDPQQYNWGHNLVTVWTGNDGMEPMGGGGGPNAPYTSVGFDGLSQIAGNGTPGLWMDGDDGPSWYYYMNTTNWAPVYAISSPITAVPEPTTLALLGSALLGLGVVYLRRRWARA